VSPCANSTATHGNQQKKVAIYRLTSAEQADLTIVDSAHGKKHAFYAEMCFYFENGLFCRQSAE
jgi:hypothetical protein